MLKNYFCHAVFYSLINHFYYFQQCAMLQFLKKRVHEYNMKRRNTTSRARQ